MDDKLGIPIHRQAPDPIRLTLHVDVLEDHTDKPNRTMQIRAEVTGR
jgi:hypothetical protein